MSFKETHTQIKEILKNSLTADNTEVITKLAQYADDLEAEYNKLSEENVKLKDTIVENVRNTTFKEEPNTEDPSQTKSLDEIMLEEAEKIVNERKK